MQCGRRWIRRVIIDVNKIQRRKEKVNMKEFFSLASITKAGECAMKPSGGRFKTNRR